MIRVLVVDDHPVVREGLLGLLADEPQFVVTDAVPSAERALHVAAQTEPDVVIMDHRLPGMDGARACEAFTSRMSRVRVIILTSFPNESILLSALGAGARGFVIKESDPAVLREAVRAVAGGGTFIDPQIAAKLVKLATDGRRATGPFGLTLREMRVLEHLPRGMTNREIGQRLDISPETVKTHVSNLLRKLDANDRTEAAAIASRKGLV